MLPDLQWIQYQLDRWATVDEVVAHADEVRVTSRTARIHFLACDRTAACAAVEYVDGKLVVHAGAELPVRTLTNDTYEASCAYLQRHEGFGGALPVPSSNESLDRFVRASHLAARAAAEDRGAPGLVDDGFALLDSVSMGPYSVWNLVYEPRSGRIHYRTAGQPRVKRIDLTRIDFSCAAGGPVRGHGRRAVGRRHHLPAPLRPGRQPAPRAAVVRQEPRADPGRRRARGGELPRPLPLHRHGVLTSASYKRGSLPGLRPGPRLGLGPVSRSRACRRQEHAHTALGWPYRRIVPPGPTAKTLPAEEPHTV